MNLVVSSSDNPDGGLSETKGQQLAVPSLRPLLLEEGAGKRVNLSPRDVYLGASEHRVCAGLSMEAPTTYIF